MTLGEIAAEAFGAIRAQFPPRYLRHNGTVYLGTAARSLSEDMTAQRIGETSVKDGAVRLLVSELVEPRPVVPDNVEISDDGLAWAPARIKIVRTERNGCVVVEYGGEYA